MQNNQFKIISLFLFLIITTSTHVFPQAFARDIEVADSLFHEKKFTESFDIYKAIYETGEHASPAMLLKMAYIREGLGDESGALYYLNTYYLQTTNDRVFTKMEELAQQNDLQGYKWSDEDWFFNIYYKYYFHLVIVLSVLTLLLSAMLIYQKFKTGKRNYPIAFSALVIITLLIVLVNFGGEYDQGILSKDNTYIMSAPSASADVLDVSQSGHRVQILGSEDVWLKIKWNDKVGYVKNTYIKQLYF